jgi:hypothetical protein
MSFLIKFHSPLKKLSWLVFWLCGCSGVKSSAGELFDHLESGFWLVHRDHVACLEDSKELKLSVLPESTSCGIANIPIGIFSFIEVFLSGPLASSSPGLTTSPVANEVFVSRVNEDLKGAVVQDVGNLRGQVDHPVTKKCNMNTFSALDPTSA